jgi:hypothetical protein
MMHAGKKRHGKIECAHPRVRVKLEYLSDGRRAALVGATARRFTLRDSIHGHDIVSLGDHHQRC